MLIPKQAIPGNSAPTAKPTPQSGNTFEIAASILSDIAKAAEKLPPRKVKIKTVYGTYEVEHKGELRKQTVDNYRETIEAEGAKQGWARVDGTVADDGSKVVEKFKKATPAQYEQAKKGASQSREVSNKPEAQPKKNPADLNKTRKIGPYAQSAIDAYDQSVSEADPMQEYTGGDMRLRRDVNKGKGLNASQQSRVRQPNNLTDVWGLDPIALQDNKANPAGDAEFWNTLKEGINKKIGEQPLVRGINALANTPMGMAMSATANRGADALRVTVPGMNRARAFQDPADQALQTAYDFTVNAPSQLLGSVGNIFDKNVDNIGKVQSGAEIAAAVVPAYMSGKAGFAAYRAAKAAGTPALQALAKGVGTAVADSVGISTSEPKPSSFEEFRKGAQSVEDLGAVRNPDGTAKFMPKPKEVPVVEKPVQMPVTVPEGTPSTSARKAMVAEDRASLGLGELDAPVRKTFGQSLDNARAKGYDGAWASREAEAVKTKPRALNDEETAGMVDVLAKLKNDHKALLKEAEMATDPADLTRINDKLMGVEKQFDNISTAVRKSGTEKGRALASQKLTINEDFDLVTIKSQAKAAKGAELSSAETAKYEDMVKRLDQAEARIAEVELKNIDLQKMLNSMPTGAKSGRRIARTDVEIKAARQDALSKIQKSVNSGAMYSGPGALFEIDYKAVAQYALTFAEQGVGKVEDVINLTLNGAKEAGIELTEKDVKKALIEWGTPKKSTREMDVALFQRDRLRKEIRESIKSMGESKLSQFRKEVTALPRAMQSTLDFSAVLRQGLHLGAGNPRKAAAAYAKAFKATIDPVYAAKIDRELYEGAQAVRRKRAGLYLASGEATNLAEEAFMSNWINKIPIFGGLSKGAERHYNTFLNQLRATVFDAEMAKFPDMSIEQQKALGDFINVATGRGRMQSNELLSNVFFSPRFMASRLQAPLDAVGLTKNGRAMWKSPAARSQVMKTWSGMIGTGLGMAALAKQFGGEVSLDPDSPDFGKMKFGDTRFDIWGGYLPQVRLLARLGKMTASTKKPSYGKDGLEIVADFLKYKVSPNVSAAGAIISKQDAVGNPRFVNANREGSVATVVEDLPKFYSPLIVKDLAELWGLSFDVDNKSFKVESTTPLPVKLAGTAGVFHGVGSSTYKKK